MQIPLSYAEDIIGIQGTNIDYIRRTSGAVLTVQESRVPDEIIVEIKGTSSEVQTAQQLIQVGDFREPFLAKKEVIYFCFCYLNYDYHIYISISALSDVVFVGIYARGDLIFTSDLVALSGAANASFSRTL